MRIINESPYPGDILKRIAVWSLSDLTPDELDVLADATITIARRPTDWDFATREDGMAYPDGTAFVYLRDGYAGLVDRDFVEATIDVVRHETQHLIQFAKMRDQKATAPVRSASDPTKSSRIEPNVSEPESFDPERLALIERKADEIARSLIDEENAYDEYEAQAAGLGRLLEWRELAPFERDQVKFGKFTKPPTHWG